MAYLDTRSGPSPASIAATVAIHGAVAAALIVGLSVSGVVVKDEIFTGIAIPAVKPPPPPTDQPKPTESQKASVDRRVMVPVPPIPLPTAAPTLDVRPMIFPSHPPFQPGRGEELVKPIPSVTPSFAALAARPRNDPMRWVNTDDYRNNWIRQEMTGRARFRLEIAADGRITACTITASSGHAELDAATCALVSRRAKFQPARGSEGEPVAGSYTNVIDWQLPR